tara:strand:- start:1228 stop:4452 length:3225 start_codon:yes stop_codon:yes gene_type:complete
MKFSWFILFCLFCGHFSIWAEEDIQPDHLTPEQTEFFEAKVRPILAEHCYDCHSNQAKKLKGKLFLDSKWGWATGGVGGPAIIPGDLVESMVIDAVKHTEELVDAMPPKYKIEDEEIAILEKWVLMGAPDPRPKVKPKDGLVEKFDLQKRFQEHWSWRPVKNPPPPQTELKDWGTSPIDQFVLSKIQAAGLQPAEPADDRTWIRRIYFDLIGLPPSPSEISEALQISRTVLIDKLLNSPRFGEKWARHWMDLMRYADTYGHEFDFAIKNAHEYRDYLIRAFNEDVPYNDFIREHLAGDLIQHPRRHPSDGYNESIIGTGFWYFHDATHGPTDVLQNESDHQDNQIDVMSKAFQGLTISCARCHDHKFDAISTADYYALTGYLNSSAKVDYPLDVGGKRKQTMAKQKKLLSSASLQSIEPNDPEKIIQSFITSANFFRKKQDAPSANEINELAKLSNIPLPLINNWVELIFQKEKPDHWTPEKFLQDFIKQPEKIQNYNWTTRDQNFANYQSNSTVFADFSKGRLPNGWVRTGLAFQFTENNRLRFDSQRPFIETASIDSSLYGKKQVGTLRSPTFTIDKDIHMRLNAEKSMVRLVIENYGMAEHSELLFKGTIYKNDSRQTNSLTAFKWIQFDPASIKKYRGKRAYLEFIDNGDGYAQVDQVRFSNAPLPHSFHPLVRLLTESGIPKNIEEAGSLLRQAWQSGDPETLNWFFHRGLADTSMLQPEVNQLVSSGEKLSHQLPAPRFALTMSQTTPENARVYVRGSYKSLGEEVPHRYLEALGAKQADRLGLANIIASPENPLTSRVMVNRIWLHLFGRGIVPTPDDFGPMGQLPSHPELLDWLANDFAQNGWSIKRTIRSIVLSQTYGQAAQASPQLSPEKISQIDPDNIMLHRMPVRRLQAEAIRDSLLAVSGRINLHSFGPGVPTHRTAFMTGRGSRPSGPLDGNGRRSIYQTIYRNFLNPFLLAFDMPSPFGPKGRRGNSNVPAQSLTLMNDPLVSKLANSWAQKTANQKDSRKRIEQMVEHAHGKIPSKEKTDQLLAFVELQGKEYGKVDQRAWADLAHALFNLKEFSYLQ